jgi:N-acetylmuramoyl-L-alanine amidase
MPLVALDAGHGGIDLGAPIVNAAGKLDTYESKINLELILALRDELHRRGYRTLLTRDGDYQLVEYLEEGAPDINGDGEHNYLDDLQARIDLINENQADLLLSIHQNAYVDGNNVRDPSVGGTVVYYCADRPMATRAGALRPWWKRTSRRHSMLWATPSPIAECWTMSS